MGEHKSLCSLSIYLLRLSNGRMFCFKANYIYSVSSWGLLSSTLIFHSDWMKLTIERSIEHKRFSLWTNKKMQTRLLSTYSHHNVMVQIQSTLKMHTHNVATRWSGFLTISMIWNSSFEYYPQIESCFVKVHVYNLQKRVR